MIYEWIIIGIPFLFNKLYVETKLNLVYLKVNYYKLEKKIR